MPYDRDEFNYAVFGQVAYDLTEVLELQLGARWSKYRSEQDTSVGFSYSYWTTFFGPLPPGSAPPDANGNGVVLFDPKHDEYDEDETDWKVNLNYTLSDTQFLYALIARGHTTGGLNVLNNDFSADDSRDPFGPMTVVSYEAGWKSTFFEGQVLTQTDIYYQTYEDYQAGFASVGAERDPAPAGQPGAERGHR